MWCVWKAPVVLFSVIFLYSLTVDPLTADFYLNPTRVNRTEAEQHCKSLNGSLVRVLTPLQDQNLRYFIDLNEGIMVLTAGVNTGTWWWLTGVQIPITYFNWKPNHPFGKNGCLAVGGTGVYYGWYSVSCNNELRSVCDINE